MALSPTLAEALIMAWLQAVGAALLLYVRVSVGTAGIVILGYPVGLGALALTSFALVLPGIPNPVLGAVLLLTAAAVGLGGSQWRSSTSRERLATVAGPIAVGVLSVPLQLLNATRVTVDSFRYLEIGALVQGTGGLDAVPDWLLLQRPLFVGLVFAPAGWLDRQYLPSLLPLLALAALAAVLWFSRLCLQQVGCRHPGMLVLPLVALAVLATSDRFVYHAFYINGHLAFAVFFLVLIAGAWLAVVRDDPGWAWPAAIAGGSLALLRLESPLMLALALVPVIASDLRSTSRWLLAGTAVAGVLLNALFVILPASTGLGEFDPALHGAIAVAFGLLALLVASHIPALEWFVRHSPAVTLALLAVPVAIASILSPTLVERTVSPMLVNVTAEGLWRATFVVLPFVTLALALVTRLPFMAGWVVPVLGFWPLLLLLGIVRGDGYRVGPGDSGNRMLMHILLVTLVYVVVAIGSSLRRYQSVDVRRQRREALGPPCRHSAGTSNGQR